jgi:hypothetical protein
MASGSKPLQILEYRQTPSGGWDLRWRQGFFRTDDNKNNR